MTATRSLSLTPPACPPREGPCSRALAQWGGLGTRAILPARPFGRLRDFGGRSCSKLLKLLLKVEAAGIEPGHFDDREAVSRRYPAQAHNPPRETGGPPTPSRVERRHPAASVDQRDHGCPEKSPISLA